MLIYNYKLKKLRHFFKTLSGTFQSGGRGGEGGWRDGVGSLFQQFGDRFFVKAFSTSLLKPKSKETFFATGQTQLFNTDIHDKEDDQQLISKESKFFKFVHSVETALKSLFWAFTCVQGFEFAP